MRIALINPPYLIIYQKLNIQQSASIPLGLLYIEAALERAGHEVKVFDPNLHNTPLPELVSQIGSFAPQLIGLTSVTPTFNAAKQISAELKKVWPAVPIVMGGPHVSVLPEPSLRISPSIDFIVVGEGEETVVELAQILEQPQQDFSTVRGLCYRRDGSVVLNAARPLIQDLDSVPYPAYHMLPVKEYAPSVVYRVREKSIFIMSSRGCPASCTFCVNQVTGRRWRVHSIDYFMGLIHDTVRKYDIRHFHFVDDNFMADQKRVEKICRRILDGGLSITWFIFARTDHCQDVELLRLMKRAGCVFIQFGIESGNEQILRQLGKKVSKETMCQACLNCKKVGIDYFNSFMIGGPGETSESVRESVDYAIQLDSIMAGFNILIPYPGTAIFKKYYQKDFVENADWERWNHITHDVPIDYRHTELSKAELDQLRKMAIRRYYLRPRQIFRILTFFRSFSLFATFLKSSWEHLFFLFSGNTGKPAPLHPGAPGGSAAFRPTSLP